MLGVCTSPAAIEIISGIDSSKVSRTLITAGGGIAPT
jgi:hypothetical protein